MSDRWSFLGVRSHAEVTALEEATRARVLAGDATAQHVFFAVHPPTVTLGRRAHADAHALRVTPAELCRRGIALVHASRGGEATAHGPGQLCIYPVVQLRFGVLGHVERIAGVIVDWLAGQGVVARCSRTPVGVFVGDRKLAACGLHISRRVAIHGFALNLTDEILPLFDLIVPCGAPDIPVTTLAREAPHDTSRLTAAVIAADLGPALVRVLRLP